MRSLASLPAAIVAAAILSSGLLGCQQLFTTSLAKSLARGSISLPSNLSAAAAADLAAQAKANDDTKLAKALVATLVDEIATTTDPATKQALEAAAASAAITASGLSSALANILGSLTGGDATSVDTQTLIDLVATVKASSSADVVTALSYLDSLPLSSGGLGATDYVIAAAVLAATLIPANTDPSNYSSYNMSDPAYIHAASLIIKAGDLVTPGSPGADLISGIASVVSL